MARPIVYKDRRVQTTIRISKDLLWEIDDLARLNDVSRSYLVDKALRYYLEENYQVTVDS